MTEIKYIGRFSPVDEKGFIINDSDLKYISPQYFKAIEEVVKKYQKHLRADLHSVYIRGQFHVGLVSIIFLT